jgi:hypothetical protein
MLSCLLVLIQKYDKTSLGVHFFGRPILWSALRDAGGQSSRAFAIEIIYNSTPTALGGIAQKQKSGGTLSFWGYHPAVLVQKAPNRSLYLQVALQELL